MTGQPVVPLSTEHGVESPRTVVWIDENWCIGCTLCIEACPSDAIKMAQTFEHSVFDRSKLTKVLNLPGSKIMEGVE